MVDGLGMVSGSDDEDDQVASDNEEVPPPLPLSLLGGGAGTSTKPVPPTSKPAATTKAAASGSKAPMKTTAPKEVAPPSADASDTPALLPAPPASAHSAARDNECRTSDASSAHDKEDGMCDVHNEPEGLEAQEQDEHSDDSDDDAKLTTPNQMPAHKPLAEPLLTQNAPEPFDAAKAAEMARKGVQGDGLAAAPTAIATNGASMAAAAPEKTPGVVDDALRNLVLMLKGEKNDSLCRVPMCQCVHGLVKDDDGKTWPPFEITLIESRQSQFARQSWLTVRMQSDPTRLFNTILFFNVDPDCVPSADVIVTASGHKLQAMLPGILVNTDDNADAAKRIAEYNEAIGTNEWTFAIPVPAQFIKSMYKQHKHGLPSLYNPITNDNVKFQLFAKVEDQCARDGRWKLLVDKSREGQANAAAANGGGRGKRSGAGNTDDGTPRKRAAKAHTDAHETATVPLPTPSVAPSDAAAPASGAPASTIASAAAAQTQGVLRFEPSTVSVSTNGLDGASSTASTDSTASIASIASIASVASVPPAPPVPVPVPQSAPPSQQPPPPPPSEQPPLPLQSFSMVPVESVAAPTFAHTSLSWTTISPEWFSVIVPKLPKGFVADFVPPTAHCGGLVSFKRSAGPLASENDM